MNTSPRYNPNAHANVCLLLEGTFPYVRGGVSSWVKQLIEGMPHLSFSIIYLGADADSATEPAYELPDNLVHLETHFLLTSSESSATPESIWERMRKRQHSFSMRKSIQQRFDTNSELHSQLHNTKGELDESVGASFAQLLTGSDAFTEQQLHEDERAWATIREKYQDAPEGLDFNHFFWTVRGMHAPLFILSEIAKQAPKADLYHSVSTGYAGFLGSMLHNTTATPYVISEHGIYTKERELDLAQVDWIPKEMDPFQVGLNDNMNYLRSVWIRFFLSLGKMSYSAASQIFTLYEGNRRRQIADGAPEEKLSIIPNGVNVERFKAVRRAEGAPVPPVLGLIGRVVPIKDIKTFIRAMQIVRKHMPDAEGWLMGPEDEDEAYTQECKMLVESLRLSHVVKFKGFQRPEDVFPQMGLCVLSSVSEGQPLVVLEGFAAGIPAVTTDVGSCIELINGVDDADKALGTAGEVISIANPSALAQACLSLLSDHDKWAAASTVAIKRVEALYDEKSMISRYESVYKQHITTEFQVGDKPTQSKAA
ncbi:MAG: GT4 family glycosyltransferase PelF [Granulosicoccus sp.]